MARLEEVMPRLRDGELARRASWPEGMFIRQENPFGTGFAFITYTPNDNLGIMMMSNVDLFAEDWMIHVPPQVPIGEPVDDGMATQYDPKTVAE